MTSRKAIAAAVSLCCLAAAGAAFACNLDAKGEKAYVTLKGTPFFAIGRVGLGAISSYEKAFRVLLKDGQAVTSFEAVLRDKDARVEGRLYALLGLKATDPKAFARHVGPFLTSKAIARTRRGCIVNREPVASLARRIQKGEFRL
jgi:hypothetical protein